MDRNDLLTRIERPENFGLRVKFLRLLNKQSQEDVGKKFGASGVALVSWEKGRNMPSQKNRLPLAKALGTTPAWLYDGRGGHDWGNDQKEIDTTLGAIFPEMRHKLLKAVKANGAGRPPSTKRAPTTSMRRMSALDPKTAKFPDKITFIKRARFAMGRLKLTNQDLAVLMDCHKATVINGISQNKPMPSETRVGEFAEALEVDYEWLLTGTGGWQGQPDPVAEPEIVPEPEVAPVVAEPAVALVDGLRPLESQAEYNARRAAGQIATPVATGAVNMNIISERIEDAIQRRNMAQVEIDQWTAVLLSQVQ